MYKALILPPLLLAIYPVINLWGTNYFIIEPADVLPWIVSLLLISICIFFILKKAVNSYYASFMTSLIFFSVTIYGKLVRRVDDHWAFWATIILVILVFIYFTKLKKINEKINPIALKAFLFFSMAFVFPSIATLSFKFSESLINGQVKIDPPTKTASDSGLTKKPIFLPHIFFIILDEHARTDMLKKYSGYDNSHFDDELKKMGFNIATRSTSNYPFSTVSLTSFMNMDYADIWAQSAKQQQPNWRDVYVDAIRNSKVSKFLKNELGYYFLQLSSEWHETAKNPYADEVVHFSNDLFIDEFSIELIDRTILRPLLTKNGSKLKVNLVIDSLNYLASKKTLPQPSFVFTHLLCPHTPYIFDENGPLKKIGSLKSNLNKKSSQYVGQVKYLDKLVLKSLEKIIQNHGENAVIVLISDHGSGLPFTSLYYDPIKDKLNDDVIQERFSNLLAVYAPKNKNFIPDDLTLVNLFPVIFNNIFETQFPIRERKHYFFWHNDQFNFVDVTKTVSNN
jgi:hypothetical protein